MNPIKAFSGARACLLTFLLAACSPAPDAVDQAPGPDLIVIDADVRTVDPGNENAAAFAISKGKFVVIGSSDEIGSITNGKWADFVILDEKLPDDVDRALENRQATATYLAGKRVFPN